MNHMKEPTEIDLYDFPWQAPLTEFKEGCFASRRYNDVIEPEDLSVLERRLFEANADDFQWANEKLKKLPEYLTKYFVTRYISVFEKKGRKAANIFLRERMEPASKRALSVLRKYNKLPTTHKMALLSEDDSNTEQSHFHGRKQMIFDFEKAEQKRKPVKNRILAELDPSEIKDMAFKIAQFVDQYVRLESDKYHSKTTLGTEMAVVFTYEQVARFVADTFGIKPPRKYKEQSELSALQDISRLISEKWWCNLLNKIRKTMREHLAIAMGQVSSKASPYASWDCIREHQEQQRANYEYIKQCELLEEETGEEADLWDMVKKSVANPAIRRHELMVRCRGCEDIGNELGLQGLFLTLTTPSKYHNSYKKGGFIGHWNGASPRDAQSYLNKVWQRIRAKLARDDIRWFGVRVAEPHHDGTPHWHLLLWVQPEKVELVTDIFVEYAIKEDRHELIDKNGKLDYSPRCDVGEIDPELGTATGYIAKYISKNIDGFAMDDDLADATITINPETGKEEGRKAKDMAKNVSAWKSRWNIRQFQFFGGAPVTTYRELRRFANQNKKAFMEYLFMQSRVDLLTIYSMLQRDIVGPIKPSKLISNEELMKVIGDSYQSRIKTETASITDTLIAADDGDWQGYIMGQGGPFVKREDLLIMNSYEVLPFASPHGEDVTKIDGFTTPETTIKTRTKVWMIKKKSEKNEDAEEGALDLSGSSAASRSSVNNCTREHFSNSPLQDTNQVERPLDPLIELEIKRLSVEYDLEDNFRSELVKGKWLILEKNKSIKLHLGDGQRRPDNLIYRNDSPLDLSWLGEPEPEEPILLTDNDDDYSQPDLGWF